MPPEPTPPVESSPSLSAGQRSDWMAVVTMLMTLPSALDAQLRADAGLNLFEYLVLVALGDAPARTLAMSDLAALSQGSPSRLSHAVGRLERDGLVERGACATGRRRVEARLTDAGWEKLVAAAPRHVREVRRLVVDALDAGQLEALGDAARAVVAGVAPGSACTEKLDERRESAAQGR